VQVRDSSTKEVRFSGGDRRARGCRSSQPASESTGESRRLSINDLQNICNPLDALEAKLKNKHLVELELIWKSDYIPDDLRKEKKYLIIYILTSTRSVCQSGTSGTKFPSWIFDNSLSNLVFLWLVDCKNCLCLPLLGILSCLKILDRD